MFLQRSQAFEKKMKGCGSKLEFVKFSSGAVHTLLSDPTMEATIQVARL
jgi:hypothetical protein